MHRYSRRFHGTSLKPLTADTNGSQSDDSLGSGPVRKWFEVTSLALPAQLFTALQALVEQDMRNLLESKFQKDQIVMQEVQIVGIVASLISCGFWIAGAGVRIRPLSLFRLRGPDSIPEALQRQSLFNAFAAVFAAIAAAAQAIVFYIQTAT